ncbi:MAG: sugar phosphate isomerase/epimerase [Candidatus Hydrogenedentes bacterium]|nr:sugar phosphate isomerase/epimerase [Candidatus Hydrogenedentota bacterium]
MTLKGRFPFRLGTTSYIIPDDVIPNVRHLATQVDDIELVLFESDEMSNIPDPNAVRILRDLADEHALSYTVHLPLDTYMGHADERIRRGSVEKCLRVIERMAPLDPFAYVTHFHGDQRGLIPSDDMPRWLGNHRTSMEELLTAAPPDLFCVETLDYPFALIEDIVADFGAAVCLDIGHLIYYGHSPSDHLDRLLEQTRVLHMHGVADGKDHRDLSNLDRTVLEDVLQRLSSPGEPDRVFTMEIFGEDDFTRSIETLRRYVPCLQ